MGRDEMREEKRKEDEREEKRTEEREKKGRGGRGGEGRGSKDERVECESIVREIPSPAVNTNTKRNGERKEREGKVK